MNRKEKEIMWILTTKVDPRTVRDKPCICSVEVNVLEIK